MKNKIFNYIITQIHTMIDYADRVQGCDLHHELFNGEGLIYTADCLQATEDLGVWDCINLVVGYEKVEFGEVNSKIEPYRIANMVIYIVGQELLNFSPTLTGDGWDRRLSEKELKKVKREIFEGLRKKYDRGSLLKNLKVLFDSLCEVYDK